MKAFLEYWKEVPGYEGIYEVSDHGTVRSLNYKQTGKRKELKPGKNSKGYETVNLCRDGVKKTCKVHRLVWEAFNGDIPEGLQIDHINGFKNDNRLENLRVVSPKENTNNLITRTRHLEAIKRLHQDSMWQESVRRAISKPVLQIDKVTGEVLREWECAWDVERELGIRQSNVSACCRGKLKSAGGYRWQFALNHYSS